VEYNVSYVYHAMYAYFDRDNVALKGLAKFFKESSEEEREHAEKFMEYQNKRGGKVKLQSIIMPLSEFDHEEKGDALYAMELALSLEKLTNEKLLNLHEVASRNNDVQLADFVESEFLGEQVEAIKKISEYVAQLRRIGKGHGKTSSTRHLCSSIKVLLLDGGKFSYFSIDIVSRGWLLVVGLEIVGDDDDLAPLWLIAIYGQLALLQVTSALRNI
ncbi:ferritin-3, chloroplastic, partial [Tanacetum coccineum]